MNQLDRKEWKVAPIGFEPASKLIKAYHYAKGHSKNFVALHGLFMADDKYNERPFGVCWWIPPATPTAAKYASSDWKNVLNLSRMVITPDAPKNAASFLLSASIKLLPERYHTLTTYADEWQGHVGTIYKATNLVYDGLTEKKGVWLDANGVMVSTRRGDKTLNMADMAQYTFLGKFAKHRFFFYRSAKRQAKQLELLAA
jgi:hypothetical protein